MPASLRPPRIRYGNRGIVRNEYLSDYCGPKATVERLSIPLSGSRLFSDDSAKNPDPRVVKDVSHEKWKVFGMTPLETLNSSSWCVWNGGDYVRGLTTRSFDLFNGPMSHFSNSPHELSDWVPDIDTLIDRFVDRIYQAPSLINFLAELGDIRNVYYLPREVQRHLRRRNQRIIGANEIRRRRFLGVHEEQQTLANAVMTTNLGVLPLWNDVVAFAQAMNNARARLDRLNDELNRGMFRIVGTRKCPHNGGTDNFSYNADVTVVYGCYLQGWVDFGSLPIYGINLDLQTLWDATPYSFVIDYLIPIGDALRRSRITAGLSVVPGSSWKSEKRDGHGVYTYDANDIGNYYGVTRSSGSVNYILKSYVRNSGIWDISDEIAVRDIELPNARSIANTLSLASSEWRRFARHLRGN